MKKIVVMLSIVLIGFCSKAEAATVDLRIMSSSGIINGAIFEKLNVGNGGTGRLDPFVRLSDGGGDIIHGYNTDARPLYYTDVNNSIQFTRDFQLSALQDNIVTLGQISYYEFLLDINQKNQNTPDKKDRDGDGDIDVDDIDPDKLLTLNQLKVYLTDSGLQNDPIGTSPLVSPIYDLGANDVLLNAGLSPGSGVGDMRALIPTSIFGTNLNKYVYFYSEFGGTAQVGGTARSNNDGFEEWGERDDTVIPEPASLTLLGLGLLGVLGFRKRK